jgi:hypothetical protein
LPNEIWSEAGEKKSRPVVTWLKKEIIPFKKLRDLTKNAHLKVDTQGKMEPKTGEIPA